MVVVAAVFTVAAAAFIVLSGMPAQAQNLYLDHYYNPYYYTAPAYTSNCTAFTVGSFSYSNCPAYAPSTVYYTTPPYYVPATVAPVSSPFMYYENPYTVYPNWP
jgi:hypothetical protein